MRAALDVENLSDGDLEGRPGVLAFDFAPWRLFRPEVWLNDVIDCFDPAVGIAHKLIRPDAVVICTGLTPDFAAAQWHAMSVVVVGGNDDFRERRVASWIDAGQAPQYTTAPGDHRVKRLAEALRGRS
jgi:hypothetical protein